MMLTRLPIKLKISRVHQLKKWLLMAFIVFLTMSSVLSLLFTSQDSCRLVMIGVLLGTQLIAALTDLEKKIIPLWLIFCSLALGIIFLYFFNDNVSIKSHITGGIVAFIIIGLLILLSRGQIGAGDLLLFSVTGFYTGLDLVLAIIFLSVTLAGVFSTFMIIFKKSSRNTEIPFAPFLLAATAVLSFMAF